MINFETELRRRFITVMLLATALLCAGYWVRAGLSAEKKQAVATVPTLVPVVAGTATELARLLGAPRPALAGPALSPTERFRAYGVIASASGQGTALMSVDKQPPRPFSVGSSIAPGFVLKSVTQREVRLSDSMQGAVTAVLPLPDPTKVKGDLPSNNLEALVLVPPEPLPNSAEPEAGPLSQPNMRGPPSTP